MNVGMTQFINTGADEDILKSLPVEDCPDELVKAMNRQGLVQKEVTVQGANGKTFTRKQWVRASEAAPGDQQGQGQPTQAVGDNKDNIIGKIPSYEGKSQAEMRVIFDGKTADVANQEIARIYKEMGSPQGNSRNYTLFQHATQPLSRLIFDAINNGTGDSTQDQSTLVKTSKIKASAGDKSIAAGKQQMQKDRADAAQKKDTSTGKLQPMPPDQKKKMDKLVHDLSHAPTAQSDGKKTSQDTPAPAKDSSSGISFDLPAHGDTKKAVTDLLASGKSRDDIMSAAKAAGITWKENDNAGINWMRASMAIQKHMKEGKPTKAAGNGSQPSTTPAQQIPSGGKKPKVFTDDGGIANVSRGGRNGQYMITRKGKKQYVMLQATKKDGSWGKPSRVELFGSETPDDALKRMQRNNPDRKWQFDPDSMED